MGNALTGSHDEEAGLRFKAKTTAKYIPQDFERLGKGSCVGNLGPLPRPRPAETGWVRTVPRDEFQVSPARPSGDGFSGDLCGVCSRSIDRLRVIRRHTCGQWIGWVRFHSDRPDRLGLGERQQP
jgi:hypothetical protein